MPPRLKLKEEDLQHLGENRLDTILCTEDVAVSKTLRDKKREK